MNIRLIKDQLVWFLLTIVLVGLFIHLGNWQFNKAKFKEQRQEMLEKGLRQNFTELPLEFDDIDEWNYRKVKVDGSYTKPVFLFDNQIRDGIAGYDVLSPLLLNNRNQVVLVNRGWIKANADRNILPTIITPTGLQNVEATIWLPPKRVFRLGQDDENSSKEIRIIEQVDIDKLEVLLGKKMVPVVLRLDSPSQTGAFNLNWPMPNERITNHLGYAYQWYGFAVATVLIYLSFFVRKYLHGSYGGSSDRF